MFIVVLSLRQYNSFTLSSDFAQYDQAVWLIAHGHLYPWSSTNLIPFNDTYFSLIQYPFALLFWLWPHGVLLLWLQDAAAVAAELVALVWVWEIAVERPPFCIRNMASVVLFGAAAVLIFNPYLYEAILFGVHPEVFCAIFVVLVLRDAWKRRFVRAAVWSVFVLLSGGDLGGLYLIGVGITLLLALPRKWWLGAASVAVGFFWFRLTQVLGVSRNSVLNGYAYLVSSQNGVSFPRLLEALVVHPARPIRFLWERRLVLYENLIPTGILGVASPWSIGTIFVILVSSALIYPLIFVESGFQNFPIYVVGIAGTALIWCALSQLRAISRTIILLLGLAVVVQSVIFGVLNIPSMPSQWITVSPAQAQVLAEGLDRTPSNAEVVADSGVIGRFSQRQWVYNIYPLPLKVPISEKDLVFVVVEPQSSGDEPLPNAQANTVIDYLKTVLHAKLLADGHGVEVLSWHPSKELRVVTLPS